MAKCDTFFARHWRDFLIFDVSTGEFQYRTTPSGPFRSENYRKRWIERVGGQPAGRLNKRGYVEVTLKSFTMRAHRLVWFVTHGTWPDCIDHIDRNRSNNRPHNLRECTVQENNFNRRPIGGASKFKGVVLYRGKWCANIRIDGKKRWLGTFSDQEAAARAYDAAALCHQGEFAVTNFPMPEAQKVATGAPDGVSSLPSHPAL